MEKEIVTLKSNSNQLETEYQIVAIDDNKKFSYIEQQIQLKQIKIDKINEDLKQFINTADVLDYTVAVSSGIICGIIDSFVVGELSFDSLKNYVDSTHRMVNKFIETFAKSLGLDKDGLNNTVSALENEFKMPQDNMHQGSGVSSTFSHHLDDLAHHPTPLGLIAGIMAQVLRIGILADADGNIHIMPIKTDIKQYIEEILLPLILGAVLSGTCCWLANLANEKYEEKYQKEIPEPIKKIIKLLSKTPAVIPILKLAHNWFGHLVSDMAGSKNTVNKSGGMGIPGIFLSLLKELSMFPPLNKSKLPQIVNDLYTKKGELGFRLDMRTEISIIKNKKQLLPVMINETLVRTFYFIRRLVSEVKANDIENIDWRKTLPFNNRTIVRMMTIATGTFTAVDIADAAIRAAVKSGGNPALFATNLVLRVNFVGIGRFAIALGADVGMGVKKRSIERQMLVYYNDTIALANGSPLMFRSDTKWITLDGKETTFGEALSHATTNVRFYMVSANAAIATASENISDFADTVVSGQQELKERLNSLAYVKEKMNCNKYNEEN